MKVLPREGTFSQSLQRGERGERGERAAGVFTPKSFQQPWLDSVLINEAGQTDLAGLLESDI